MATLTLSGFLTRLTGLALVALALTAITTTSARAAEPLELTLESSRDVCTANTLTELSWTISGGQPPYTLSIDGEPVDPESGPLQVNCGPLPVDLEGNTLSTGTKTFSASVTDSYSDLQTETASVEVDLAEPLPAPDPRFPFVDPTTITTSWVTIDGARAEDGISRYLIRWRPSGELQWNYELVEEATGRRVTSGRFGGLNEQSTNQYALATLRDPLEQHTPDALLWSSEQEATTTTTPTGLAASRTHDAITVSWDDQPSVQDVTVRIRRADGVGKTRWVGVRRDETPPNQTTLVDLDPNTEYYIRVGVPGRDQLELLETSITVTTAAAPSGWTAPARGAQNVQVTTTTDSFTITWEAPLVNTSDSWFVIVRHPEAEYSYTDYVSAPLTFSLDRLWPGNTYTVILRHRDLHYVEVTTTVTTDSAASALVRTSTASAVAQQPAMRTGDVWPDELWLAERWRTDRAPLLLSLTSSRALCTANTLTELSWTISGGQPPYTLSIDGEPVDPESGPLQVNCGPLPVDLEGNRLSTGTKTFSASVTDSYSDPQTETASVELDLAEPLPAPSWIGHYHFGDASVAVAWPEVAYDADETRRPLYLIRYRAVGALDWTYEPAGGAETSLRPAIGAHEVSVAAQRHFLEDESPDALSWSPPYTFARVVAPANVTAVATHDTVTVSWDGQPYSAERGSVWLIASNGRLRKGFERPDTNGRQSVTFEHVLPDTTFRVEVQMEVTESNVGLSVTEVTMEPAPSDWTPIPTGPANLSVTATASSITVEWDLPHPDAPKPYHAYIQDAETDVVVSYTSSSGDPGEWTTRGDYHWIKPATTYRVTVVHFALPRASEEVTITTPASDPPVPAANRQPSTEILGNEALGVAALAAASE